MDKYMYEYMKFDMSNINFTHYLPNTEKRIEHLREIINGRPVAILVPGPSIQELENRIGELHNADICYVSINNFLVIERHILQKINKHFNICFSVHLTHLDPPEPIGTMNMKSLNDFFNKYEENMFISMVIPGSDRILSELISKYDKKLLFISIVPPVLTVPNIDNPLHFYPSSSLLVLIQLMIIGKPSKIILFGADGADNNIIATDYCYRQDEYIIGPRSAIANDTYQLNNIAHTLIRNVYNTYNIVPIDILNCSENSYYTPFPKISYNRAFELLNDKKK